LPTVVRGNKQIVVSNMSYVLRG